MKTRLIIATIPVMVVGGMILFLGCGAQTQKAGHAETGSSLSAATVAAIPAATNLTAAPAEAVPKIVTAPPKLSPGVDEIVQLAQAGVGDEVLQAYIENSPVAYKLDVEQILYLHDLGLSAETIAAMVRRSQSLQDRSANSAAARGRAVGIHTGHRTGQVRIERPRRIARHAVGDRVVVRPGDGATGFHGDSTRRVGGAGDRDARRETSAATSSATSSASDGLGAATRGDGQRE